MVVFLVMKLLIKSFLTKAARRSKQYLLSVYEYLHNECIYIQYSLLFQHHETRGKTSTCPQHPQAYAVPKRQQKTIPPQVKPHSHEVSGVN